MERYKIINGNNLEILPTLEDKSVDSIITDPPYGLTSITKRYGKENSAPAQHGKLSKGFMGKVWDGTGIEYNVELWKQAYRVLKPGGFLLAFGGTRTYHRMTCAIEDAGFEIKDCIMWLYGSGFPKSHNVGLEIDKALGCENRGHRIAVANRNHPDGTLEPNGEMLEPYEPKTEEGKKWKGWGTSLKPAYEPIIVARKPCEESIAKNCLKYGTGAYNIEECRVGEEIIKGGTAPDLKDVCEKQKQLSGIRMMSFGQVSNAKRVELKDHIGRFPANVILTYDETDKEEVCSGMGESARYFYCAKASKKDRDEGLESFEEKQTTDGGNRTNKETALRKNTHPTVKPTELMQYLIRLVTQRGGVILDIFNGSGSTGKAVAYENLEHNSDYKYIGIELDKEYCEISKARIKFVEELPINEQLTLF